MSDKNNKLTRMGLEVAEEERSESTRLNFGRDFVLRSHPWFQFEEGDDIEDPETSARYIPPWHYSRRAPHPTETMRRDVEETPLGNSTQLHSLTSDYITTNSINIFNMSDFISESILRTALQGLVQRHGRDAVEEELQVILQEMDETGE